MPLECETRFLVSSRDAELGLRRVKNPGIDVHGLYALPDTVKTRLIANHSRRLVPLIVMAGHEIEVEEDKQRDFYGIITRGLTDAKGVLQLKDGINIRVKQSEAKYKFAIKADPTQKDLDKLYRGVPQRVRERELLMVKIKPEWQTAFAGKDLFRDLFVRKEVTQLRKVKYRISEDGRLKLEEVKENGMGLKFTNLWIAEYDYLKDRGVLSPRPSWLRNSPSIMALSSRNLAGMDEVQFSREYAQAMAASLGLGV